MQPQDFQIEPGAVVLARDGFIGTVEEVFPAPVAGQPGYFSTAPNQNGDRLLIPLDLIAPNSAPGEVFLKEVFQNIIPRTRSVSAGQDPRAVLSQMSDGQAVPAFSGQPSNSGFQISDNPPPLEFAGHEIHKTVEQVHDGRRVPLTYDELEVEHVVVNRMIDAPLNPRYEGDVYIIPVMEEVLVVEKRLMLKEEVRITRRQTTRDQAINETLRREQVEITPQTVAPTATDDIVDEIIDADLDPSEADLPLTEQPTLPNSAIPYSPLGYERPDGSRRPGPSEEPA